ncbi:MAG TPA: hypothetical protein VL691_03975, partial [Vicinamibacteria bacterium]|nr:hypothetical protein [Vicinamibacteria bacterium]
SASLGLAAPSLRATAVRRGGDGGSSGSGAGAAGPGGAGSGGFGGPEGTGCSAARPGRVSIAWHFGQRTLNGRSGTLASSTWIRVEQLGH